MVRPVAPEPGVLGAQPLPRVAAAKVVIVQLWYVAEHGGGARSGSNRAWWRYHYVLVLLLLLVCIATSHCVPGSRRGAAVALPVLAAARPVARAYYRPPRRHPVVQTRCDC
eukprot:scaffold55909_cov63-Phaeocystis_antarctica.AAC.1